MPFGSLAAACLHNLIRSYRYLFHEKLREFFVLLLDDSINYCRILRNENETCS